jgi:uncharacterized protein YgbK (DUF1537 family)
VRQVKKQLLEHRVVLLETAGAARREPDEYKGDRKMVSEQMARALEDVLDEAEDCGVVVLGGDTLQAIANRLFRGAIYPEGEIEAGVPVSSAIDKKTGKTVVLVSKAGGLGQIDIIGKIINFFKIGEKLWKNV